MKSDGSGRAQFPHVVLFCSPRFSVLICGAMVPPVCLLPWFSDHVEKGREGTAPIFKWHQWLHGVNFITVFKILLVSHKPVLFPFPFYYFRQNSPLVHGTTKLLILPGLLDGRRPQCSPLLEKMGRALWLRRIGDWYPVNGHSASFSLTLLIPISLQLNKLAQRSQARHLWITLDPLKTGRHIKLNSRATYPISKHES